LSPLTNLEEFSPLFIKLLGTLVKKKLYYKIISTKEAKLKKNINSNIGKQNIVTEKRIKK
jgi:hypothetical protein